jgi:hypothetical protein
MMEHATCNQKNKLLGYFYFQQLPCTWDNDGTANLQHQKSELLGYFLSTCTWDNDGAKPATREKVNCWDTFTFNTSTCTWDNDGTTQPAEKK